MGVADLLLEELETLLRAAQQRLESCECELGCPSCIHMAGCGEYNEGLDKPAARRILRWLLQPEKGADADVKQADEGPDVVVKPN